MELAAMQRRDPSGSTPLAERLRSAHLSMVDAVVGGEGLQRVAELAAQATASPVAILVPRHDIAVAAPAGAATAMLPALRRHVSGRARRGRGEPPPDGVLLETPIASGGDTLGAVVLLAPPPGSPPASSDAAEFLHLAAVAALTEVALEQARAEVEQTVRGDLFEDLRSGREVDGREILRRGARLGCNLAHGAIALCAELSTERPRHVVALIAGDHPGALAQFLDGRVYAILPAPEGPGGRDRTADVVRRLAVRLQRYGTVGISSFYSEPAELGRAVQEAELVLDAMRHSDSSLAGEIGTGTYRLLFRVLASHPEEVRAFYEDTVAPVVRYDDRYRTDLTTTLGTYLEQNCNMNATAAAMYAHRHTIAYRLDRVRELTGLDPTQSEDRERLGLGLKALRIIGPRLPR